MCNEVVWVGSIIIPNVNDSESRIVNGGDLAKHCPVNPLFVAIQRVDFQQNILEVDMQH